MSRQTPLAIVTGASSGIGRELACLLSARGYRCVLVARRRSLLEALATDLGPNAIVLPMDLCDLTGIEGAMDRLVAEHGVPRVLINNAGFGQYTRFLETTTDDQHRLMDVLYHAPSLMIRSLLPSMLKAGEGHVINIGSMSTRIGPWGHSGYAAAKSALVSLTQTLAAEYSGRGVHFSYVNPGIVCTSFFDRDETRPIFKSQIRHAISALVVAKATIGLLDRPRLELCVPRYYRLLDWIRALSPSLAHRLVSYASRPTTKAVDAACPAASDIPSESPAPSAR